jgi:hypothetical protein
MSPTSARSHSLYRGYKEYDLRTSHKRPSVLKNPLGLSSESRSGAFTLGFCSVLDWLFLLGLFWATDLPDIDYFNRLAPL